MHYEITIIMPSEFSVDLKALLSRHGAFQERLDNGDLAAVGSALIPDSSGLAKVPYQISDTPFGTADETSVKNQIDNWIENDPGLAGRGIQVSSVRTNGRRVDFTYVPSNAAAQEITRGLVDDFGKDEDDR